MRKIRPAHALLLVAACLFLSGGDAHARRDARLAEIIKNPQELRLAQDAGHRTAAFCANCHGDNGVSNLPEVPNLAGQNVDYLLEKTRKLGADERRDPSVHGLINALQEEEKIQLSIFYASQNPGRGRPPTTIDAFVVETGRLVYERQCARCHGERARGDEFLPHLASQREAYIVSSVTRLRDINMSGERREPIGCGGIPPLRDADIKAVAAYLASLP